MIFAYTLDAVLRGESTQTSRLWENSWKLDHDNKTLYLLHQSGDVKRPYYYVGQVIGIRAERFAERAGKIRITKLERRDVREFCEDDFRREGVSEIDFWALWTLFYGRYYDALVIQFELVKESEVA